MTHYGPIERNSERVHAEKYRATAESFREAMGRIAGALSDNSDHFQALRDILLGMRFMPAGRIQAFAGSTKAVTPYNCYVSGTIEDSLVAGSGSICHRLTEAAETMRMGGGIGYDFSPLRPRGTLIRKLQSNSTGPISWMGPFDAVCRAVSSSGHRRGAQMGVLRVDHPDIEEFVRAKQNNDQLTGFNISVAVSDEFMHCVRNDLKFELRHGGQYYRTIRAKDLWYLIMRSTYDWAEPGVLFIDTINHRNNLYYCEKIAATNPCGEQPLPPFGACLLGSFNLVKYLERTAGKWKFNYVQLFLDIPHVVRAMDNVVDRARYPLYEQEQEAQSKRRMGLGVTGLANCIESLGAPYGSEHFIVKMRSILRAIRDGAYKASVQLASEKGAFPKFGKDAYLAGHFTGNLPDEIRDSIATFGIRNSHLLSIAPTGTISLSADNISSGIEPVFEYESKRAVHFSTGIEILDFQDFGYKYLDTRGKLSDEVSADEHVAVLACASEFVDSAVSKTCNVPKDYSWEDFQSLYFKAWDLGCKGCATFRKGGLRGAMMEKSEAPPVEDSTETCTIDPITGKRDCA